MRNNKKSQILQGRLNAEHRRREALSEKEESPTADAQSVAAGRGGKEERIKGSGKLETRQQPSVSRRIFGTHTKNRLLPLWR